jgi:predicted anti-sigma-YlaC factor YlaD
MISNCDDVRGMLPWLLNGTLDDGERARVLQHLTTCEACRRDLADTRLAAEIFDQHPPAEAILALAWDETPRGIDPALLEEHLESCPRCTAELELARMSRRLEEDERIVPLPRKVTPTPAPVPVTGWRGWKSAALAAGLAGVVAFTGWFQTAGRVHTLEERLATRAVATAPAPVPVPAPPVAGGSGEEATGAGRQAAELEKQLQEMEARAAALRAQEQELRRRADQLAAAQPSLPQINGRIETVQPGGDVVRGNEPTGLHEIQGKELSILLLTANHPESHREHAIEIVDAAGKTVWSADGLVRDADHSLYQLRLPSGALRPGTYAIRVYGMTEGRREPLETYTIRVT